MQRPGGAAPELFHHWVNTTQCTVQLQEVFKRTISAVISLILVTRAVLAWLYVGLASYRVAAALDRRLPVAGDRGGARSHLAVSDPHHVHTLVQRQLGPD